MDKWTDGKPKTTNPYRVYQPKVYTERIPLVEKYKEEFHYRLPIIIDSMEKDCSVGLYLSGKDLLWLGALEKDQNSGSEWKVVWRSGEIPYEYDMGRLQEFLLSRWLPDQRSFPTINEEEIEESESRK